MRRPLDIDTWKRKSHFHFFKSFDEPLFGITTNVDCTRAYNCCADKGYSFFLYYLHKALVAANRVESFRYRTDGEEVWVYDNVHATPTILRNDETFGFSYMPFEEDFTSFAAAARQEIERVKAQDDLKPAEPNSNVIHFSSLPWIDFTSFSHARMYSAVDSCPKISFGKMTGSDGSRNMPVSVHVHHALMDGLHVGRFMDTFQQLMNA